MYEYNVPARRRYTTEKMKRKKNSTELKKLTENSDDLYRKK